MKAYVKKIISKKYVETNEIEMKKENFKKPRQNWEKQFKEAIKQANKPETKSKELETFFAGWKYRIMAFTDGNIEWFEIHEVHYKNKTPLSYAENPVYARGILPELLIKTLQSILKDVQNTPVIWSGDRFPQEYKISTKSKMLKKVANEPEANELLN